MREVLTASYPFLRDSKFNLKTATHDQLAERFKEMASGDTVRKCMTFFIPAAKQAGIEMSPFIREIGKRAPSNGKPRKVRAPAKPASDPETPIVDAGVKPPATMGWHELLLSKFPSFDPNWPDDVKKKWFDSFADLMSRGATKE